MPGNQETGDIWQVADVAVDDAEQREEKCASSIFQLPNLQGNGALGDGVVMGAKKKQVPVFVDRPGPLAAIEDWIEHRREWIGSRLNFV